jgi:hypothetical protein
LGFAKEKINLSALDHPGSLIIRPNPSKVNVLGGRIPNLRFWEIAAATIEDLAFGIRS